MNLNFEISLTDIGIGLELSGNSESERQEVMDFLVHVDGSVADYEFSQELIIRLTTSFAEGSEVRGDYLVTLPSGFGDREVSFNQLCAGLSYLDEDKLIALLANAVAIKRERASKERNTCETCGHPSGVHNLPCNELMATSTSCHACFEAVKGKPGKGCAQCSCPRGKHTVSVGGEATGCIIHVDCDEFKEEA